MPSSTYLAISQKKLAQPKQQRKNLNLSLEQCQENAIRAAAKQCNILQDVVSLQDKFSKEIAELAKKHSMTYRYMEQCVCYTAKFTGYRRNVNLYNVWQHCIGLKINECKYMLRNFG
jgi:hypothetical protein